MVVFELGEYSKAEHHNVVELLKEHKLENALLVGSEFYTMREEMPFTCFKTTDECRNHLIEKAVEGHTILIKGSRGMKMEVLQEVL